MISTAAGPRLPHALESEKTYQVEDELGQELIAVRAAKEVADPSPKAQEHATEVAAIEDGEIATDPGADKKAETLMDKLKKPSKADAAKK
jgi:hypothetical protein